LTNTHWGTGYFVHTPNNWYVLTAAHVASESFPYTAAITLSLDNGDNVNARMILPHEKWEFHPDGGDKDHLRVDVAAMKIRYPGGGLRSFLYCAAKCSNNNEYNQLDADPEPPDVVMTFGFPGTNGMAVGFSRPLGRQGMVAFVDSTSDTISVENKWFDKRGLVIDIPTIAGGASESPVIKMPPFGRLMLVGVMSASNTNLGGGYAIAEPASSLAGCGKTPLFVEISPGRGVYFVDCRINNLRDLLSAIFSDERVFPQPASTTGSQKNILV
jgi:hypothetical protein